MRKQEHLRAVKVCSKILLLAAILPLVQACVPKELIRVVTPVFSDDFSTDSGRWEYLGSAYRDRDKEYLVLTQAEYHQAGRALFVDGVDFPFKVSFRYWVGGGTGADGFILLFYKKVLHGAMTGMFFNGPNCEPVPGYGVEFDNSQNIEDMCGANDPSANHIALLKDRISNHVAYASDARTEGGRWHSVEIFVGKGYGGLRDYVEVYVDGGIVLDWTGTLQRQFTGFGFAGASWGMTNWHIIDDVVISRLSY